MLHYRCNHKIIRSAVSQTPLSLLLFFFSFSPSFCSSQPRKSLKGSTDGTITRIGRRGKRKRSRRRFARRRVARIPRIPRFPRIATYADTITQRSGRRLRADPSTHISGIVHSCPHLGYLNYICNAYRGTVGTEYVGADPAHTRHPRTLARVSHVRAFTHRRTHA